MNYQILIGLIAIIALALVIYDLYKVSIKAVAKAILYFLRSPAKAINSYKEKKAKKAKEPKKDKKEIKLRIAARDRYLNNDYLYIDKFTEDEGVQAYLEIKESEAKNLKAKENLKRHKQSLKKKK